VRIARGLVRVGVDTDASTLGPEAVLEDALSATKGCYTGQEIVGPARDLRPPEPPRCASCAFAAPETAGRTGTTLVEGVDHEPVGRITSTAPLPGQQGRIGLAYLPREFWKPGSELRARDAAGPPVYVLDAGVLDFGAA
jgi:glycine cleavage system aminomethyltransferase T